MERDELPADVLFVGGGPANLVGAIHLMNLIEAHNEAVSAGDKQGEVLDEPMIVVIEKGSEIGQHQLSGAIVDPKALEVAVPDWKTRDGFPLERWVEKDEFVLLREGGGKIKAPWLPPEMDNLGKPIVSLGRLCKWLAEIAEEKGVMVTPGFSGASLLYEGDKVSGVRCGDRGIAPDGSKKPEYEPGADITAAVTILGEGPRGHLTRKLIERYQLDEHSNPMAYELGCKEVLELPEGTVTEGYSLHGLGWPIDSDTFGGMFMYSMGGDRVCIGCLVALDAHNPHLDVHHMLQMLKTHPFIRDKIGEGKVVKYGAKAVTIGGWNSIPQLYAPGAMIVGDSASFLNPMRVKGIHLSMMSGILAAETAFDAMLSGDSSAEALSAYKRRVDDSWIREEMETSANMHAHFAKAGLFGGLLRFGVDWMFGAGEKVDTSPDFSHMAKAKDSKPLPEIEYDGTYLVDKLTDVYHSGTKHEEKQPAHLKIVDTEICATTCKEEYGNPCTKFCPAQVYNMVPNEETGRDEMQVDFSNCVHCKTCDIRDPYQVITWVPPEAGDGPEYTYM